MITPDFNIYNLVQNMRTQRPSLVQTKVVAGCFFLVFLNKAACNTCSNKQNHISDIFSCQMLPCIKDLLMICLLYVVPQGHVT